MAELDLRGSKQTTRLNRGKFMAVESTQTSIKIATICFSVVYAIVFLAMIIVHPGTESQYTDFHNFYQILPPFFAGYAAISYFKSGSRSSCKMSGNRLGWLFIGLGAFSFAIGQSTWTLYESILRLEELPSPGPADIGYVLSYPLLIAGVILLFGTIPVVSRARLLMDSALAAGSVGLLSWYFVASRIWGDPSVNLWGKMISVAYPLGDVAVFLCAVVLLSSPKTDLDLKRPLIFLACGIVLIAFADTFYTLYNLAGNYRTGSWFDWGWSFGWLLVAFGALIPLWWPKYQKVESSYPALISNSRSLKLGKALIPYLAVASAFFIVAADNVDSNYRVDVKIILAGSVLISLVILRQILTLLENGHLTDTLRAFNSNLEKVVTHRTEQISALLQLTKLVNNTRHESEVIAVALDHAQTALQADAVFLQIADGNNPKCLSSIHFLGLEDYPELKETIAKLPLTSHLQNIHLTLHPDNPSIQTQYISAPLLWQGKAIGNLGAFCWNGIFNEADMDVLESIGVEVGNAYENARRFSAAIDAADRDSVTDLFNHRAIHQRLDDELGLSLSREHPLTVIMMDLNNFKLFNDTYGHPVGDQVLKHVAQILKTESRTGDIIGRYGGDEFIVVLPETDAETALNVAQRLRKCTDQHGFNRQGEDRTIPVTLSFGLATCPLDSNNRHELLAIADANLYAAKGSAEGIRGTTNDQRLNRRLRTEGTYQVLDAMVTAVDNKDSYTRRHSEDVTSYALWLGEAMGLSEETLRIIRIGGLLHDVGKIGVPDEILRKPGRLTAEEFEILKRHPRLGELIVGALPGMEEILDIVRSHHERWDGHGYPEGLKGEDIPVLGRLVALADAFSAMTTNRPYRTELSWEKAIEEIEANVGTQFDPVLAPLFVRAVRKRLATSAPGAVLPVGTTPVLLEKMPAMEAKRAVTVEAKSDKNRIGISQESTL